MAPRQRDPAKEAAWERNRDPVAKEASRARPRVILTMDPDVRDRVDAAAAAEGVSRSQWLEDAARERLGRRRRN